MSELITAGYLAKKFAEIDPETPVFYNRGGGEFVQFQTEESNVYGKQFMKTEMVQSISDSSFWILKDDPFYKTNKKSFHKPIDVIAVF